MAPVTEATALVLRAPVRQKLVFASCALCLAAPATRWEHVPTASTGGRKLTKTCVPCNNGFGPLEQPMPRVLGTKVQMVIESGGMTSRAFGYRPVDVTIGGRWLPETAVCLFVPRNSIAVAELTFKEGYSIRFPDRSDVVGWALLKHAVLAATLADPAWARLDPYLRRARRMLRAVGLAAHHGRRIDSPPDIAWTEIPELAGVVTVGNEHLSSGVVRPLAVLGRYVVYFPVLVDGVVVPPPAMPPSVHQEVDLTRAASEYWSAAPLSEAPLLPYPPVRGRVA